MGVLNSKCSACRKTLPINKFSQDLRRFNGVSSRCINCKPIKSVGDNLTSELQELQARVQLGFETVCELIHPRLVRIPENAINALVKDVLNCKLCCRRGFLVDKGEDGISRVSTCVCHLRLLVRIADLQNEPVQLADNSQVNAGMGNGRESMGSAPHGGDDDPLESDGEFQRRGIQEG